MAKKTATQAPVSEAPASAQEAPVETSHTQSRLREYLTCPRLEYYRYRAGNGYGVSPVKKESYFIEGEFGHYALKHWYRSQRMLRENLIKRVNETIESFGALDPEEANDLRVKLSAMVGACHAYKARYRTDFDKYDILAVEQPFKVKVGAYTFEGVLDLAIRDKETGQCGFMDHKWVGTVSRDQFAALPLDIQGLFYSLGFKSVLGTYPSWYMFNYIIKSHLRQKGVTKTSPMPESLMQYEARVQEQYREEPDKLFFRPPPILVEAKMLERVEEQVLLILSRWKQDSVAEPSELPMNFTSCMGRYGNLCAFGQACTAYLAGKSDQGWDAPQCRGIYKPKEILHPELVQEKEE